MKTQEPDPTNPPAAQCTCQMRPHPEHTGRVVFRDLACPVHGKHKASPAPISAAPGQWRPIEWTCDCPSIPRMDGDEYREKYGHPRAWKPISAGLTRLYTRSDFLNNEYRRPIPPLDATLAPTAVETADEMDKELGRWQEAISDLLFKLSGKQVDGAGCDSGDPLDLTLTEIKLSWPEPADAGTEDGALLDTLQEITTFANVAPIIFQEIKIFGDIDGWNVHINGMFYKSKASLRDALNKVRATRKGAQ